MSIKNIMRCILYNQFVLTTYANYNTQGNNIVKYRLTVLTNTDTDNTNEYQKYYAMFLLLPIYLY